MRLPLTDTKLGRLNNLLLASIVLVCVYIIGLPLWPQLSFWWQTKQSTPASFTEQAIAEATQPDNGENGAGNQLIVPSLRMRQPLHEGVSKYTVNKGIWVQPKASTPDKDSNTVLIGHRFTYRGPAVFYHLDKIKVGEPLIIFWQGKQYHYRVTANMVVPPTAIEIEAPTTTPTLTLYTCTPLITAKNRLVIRAERVML